MLNNFVGKQKPLDPDDMSRLSARLGASAVHLQTFVNVESRARGFDRKGRPIMLFEPHIFYRLLNGRPDQRSKAVKARVAYKSQGTRKYPSDSYPQLLKAVQINEDMALRSCSIGLSQVLVNNYASIGYDSPQDMWREFMDDEEAHIDAMVNYLLVNHLDDELREEKWAQLAKGYNGPGYARNQYDSKLRKMFSKLTRASSKSGVTSGVLKSVQERLKVLGYHEVGKPDGDWGSKTRGAVLAFRADNELPLIGKIDDDFLAVLMGADKRVVAAPRASTTLKEIRATGSRTVEAADRTSDMGVITTVGGALSVGLGYIDEAKEGLESVKEIVSDLEPYIGAAKSVFPWLLVAVGAYVVYQQYKVKKARVEDVREGKHVGR